MRDESNVLRAQLRALQQPAEALDDAGRDAFGRIVRGRHFDASDQFARCRVDRDHVGKRTADVDPDARSPFACARFARSAQDDSYRKSAVRTNVTIEYVTRPACS